MPYGWIFSMGTGKYVVDSSAFGKNAQKSPEALHFRGDFLLYARQKSNL